jgi:hypothetical protein
MPCWAMAATVLAAISIAGTASAGRSHIDPQGRLSLSYGERVVAHLDDTGGIVIDKAESLDAGASGGGAEDASADHIVFTLSSMGAMGSMLKVKDGYDWAFNYKALLFRGGGDHPKTVPTTVCTVIAHGSGFENWPFAFDGILIGPITKAAKDEFGCR